MNGLRATLNENETMNLVDNDQVKMTIKTLHKPDIEEEKTVRPPDREGYTWKIKLKILISMDMVNAKKRDAPTQWKEWKSN